MKGTILGPYEVVAHIGTGGMGEVWRARDKRIGRDVAVKVLPQELGTNDDYVRRFEHEARAAGALNHPGLVTIFDVGTVDGAPYIVMELLDGETLRDALVHAGSAPLPLRKTVDYAIQIASALAVAHEKGIIHRDLKPENLVVTSEGRVKILDFGLAKLTETARDTDDRDVTARQFTSSGVVVGTPGYMSPEQVRAKPLDHRTDIFSFGAVLYEMLSGRRAFDGESGVETMNAVISSEPAPLATVVPDIPAALDTITRHCLEKNPRDRCQSARDLAFDLRMLPELQKTDAFPPVSHDRRTKRRFPYRAGAVVLALLALAGGEYAFRRLRGGVATMPHRTFKQLTFADGQDMYPALAPDGKTFAYVSAESGNLDIYVQRVDGLTATNITAESPDDDTQPAFSPDGSQIAFRSARDGGGIFVMGVNGESVRRLTDFGYTPSWSPDGAHIVVATEDIEHAPAAAPSHSELWVIDTRTGAKRQLVKSQGRADKRENNAVQPSWSPNGKRIAYWGVSNSSGHRDLSTIDPNAPRPSETIVAVTADPAFDWNPVWSADGKFLYFGSDRDGTINLWRIAIDEESGKPAGAPEPLSLPASFAGNFSVSKNEIVYATMLPTTRVLAFPFDDASGKTAASKTLMAGSQEILSFRPSPDGRFLAYTTGGMQEDLFVANIDGTHRRQLTNDAAKDRGVTWSPDGKTLYFYSNRSGSWDVWSMHVDGSALARVGSDEEYRRLGIKSAFLSDVSPDGRTLTVQTDSSPALIHLDRPPGRRVERLGTNSLRVTFLVWSPDGKQLAAQTASAGVAVYSFQTHRFETVSNHGMQPAWLPDGHRITYLDPKDVVILDLQSGKTTTAPLPPEMHNAILRLSKDGSTLYGRQNERRGNIWVMRMETP